MSEEPDNGERDDGGRPRDQSQGGQPQSQPQGQPVGRSRAGRTQTGRGAQQTGLNVDTNYLREWAVYLSGLLGVGGLGVGVLAILTDGIDEPVFEASGGGLGAAVSAASVSTILPTMSLVLPIVGLFLGTWLGTTLRGDDQELFVIVGASVAAGVAVFFFVSSLLLSVSVDNASLNFGGLVINMLLIALAVGATAAGGVAATRSLAPRDLSVR